MQRYSIDLVDNEEFITWASSSPNPDHDPMWREEDPELVFAPELDDWAKEKFYRANGAKPIQTLDQLRFALGAMFWHRNSWGLEFAAIMDMMMMPDLSTCTERTQQAGW